MKPAKSKIYRNLAANKMGKVIKNNWNKQNVTVTYILPSTNTTTEIPSASGQATRSQLGSHFWISEAPGIELHLKMHLTGAYCT